MAGKTYPWANGNDSFESTPIYAVGGKGRLALWPEGALLAGNGDDDDDSVVLVVFGGARKTGPRSTSSRCQPAAPRLDS